jgi:hypothetical protein
VIHTNCCPIAAFAKIVGAGKYSCECVKEMGDGRITRRKEKKESQTINIHNNNEPTGNKHNTSHLPRCNIENKNFSCFDDS